MIDKFSGLYRDILRKLLPFGTKRRYYYELGLVAIRVIRTDGWKSFLHRFRRWLRSRDSSQESTMTPDPYQLWSTQIEPSKQERGRRKRESLLAVSDNVYARLYESLLATTVQRESSDYVPQSLAEFSACRTPVKLIAFYLPQFHPIPENDDWWGKGFTDWINVTRAVPQFLGHYQPRRPGELGFYDLRIPEVQRRQVELAKHYGIYGFCFHFYWFDGRTLLERPLQQFVASTDMDFRFCINWANENWTRRWDGLDKDVLIGQNHSADDDLAFITYISRYLKDDRYIRVDSKPLLIVYRPALLPDAKKTAERWRKWCLDNGIGEIYLALTHAFEHVDPRHIGFDAAVEFAPNTFPLSDIKDRVDTLNPRFRGSIFDYNDALGIARNYCKPPYRKYRGLCPGWDNEARKPGRSNILAEASPGAFRQWLKMLCHFTVDSFPPEERLVFVNAWNEWAEGAYLEPDRRLGYAYLQAVSDALRHISGNSSSVFTDRSVLDVTRNRPAATKVAVVLHLYYTDLWHEIASYLKNIPQPFDLFVSVPSGVPEAILLDITRDYPEAVILHTENRGRDIAPFLELLDVLVRKGYSAVLKIHTKRSTHRGDGDVWRRDILSKLVGDSRVAEKIIQCLKVTRDVGLVVPSEHLVNLKCFIGSPDNVHHLEDLAQRLSLTINYGLSFCASTMFWFKPDALSALLRLKLDSTDFEPETGQTDGTLAHSMERFFGQVVAASEYKIVTDRSVLDGQYRDNNPTGATYYKFAQRTG